MTKVNNRVHSSIIYYNFVLNYAPTGSFNLFYLVDCRYRNLISFLIIIKFYVIQIYIDDFTRSVVGYKRNLLNINRPCYNCDSLLLLFEIDFSHSILNNLYKIMLIAHLHVRRSLYNIKHIKINIKFEGGAKNIFSRLDSCFLI